MVNVAAHRLVSAGIVAHVILSYAFHHEVGLEIIIGRHTAGRNIDLSVTHRRSINLIVDFDVLGNPHVRPV